MPLHKLGLCCWHCNVCQCFPWHWLCRCHHYCCLQCAFLCWQWALFVLNVIATSIALTFVFAWTFLMLSSVCISQEHWAELTSATTASINATTSHSWLAGIHGMPTRLTTCAALPVICSVGVLWRLLAGIRGMHTKVKNNNNQLVWWWHWSVSNATHVTPFLWLFCICSRNKNNMCSATSELQWWHLLEAACVELAACIELY